jgi:nucleotide-binding universal stress UspA family protein
MTIKHILVHLDRSDASAGRLEAAVRLAVTHDAHLTGLYVIDLPSMVFYGVPDFPAEYAERFEAEEKVVATNLEKRFQERIAKEQLSAEWRTAEGHTVTMIGLHARYADLAVIGQAEHEALTPQRELPENVVLGIGRPVLIIPYIGAQPTIGENILVAWNASREAMRAITDALPILERAKNVVVIAFNPGGGVDGHGDIPSADISLWLARHGVKAEAKQAYASDMDTGNALLSSAADLGSDLLVMGAYGHSRLRELVLGGATRQILSEMTIPVLMSH